VAFLRWCEAYPVDQVVGALGVYLDKDYAGEGKAENYAKGIIRNWQAVRPGNGSPATSPPKPKMVRLPGTGIRIDERDLTDSDRRNIAEWKAKEEARRAAQQ